MAFGVEGLVVLLSGPQVLVQVAFRPLRGSGIEKAGSGGMLLAMFELDWRRVAEGRRRRL